MITAHDIFALAAWMVEQHGPRARNLADCAIREMDAAAEAESADAWRALASVVGDLLEGRLEQSAPPRLH